MPGTSRIGPKTGFISLADPDKSNRRGTRNEATEE